MVSPGRNRPEENGGGVWNADSSLSGGTLTLGRATEVEVAVTAFAPLLGLLEEV